MFGADFGGLWLMRQFDDKTVRLQRDRFDFLCSTQIVLHRAGRILLKKEERHEPKLASD